MSGDIERRLQLLVDDEVSYNTSTSNRGSAPRVSVEVDSIHVHKYAGDRLAGQIQRDGDKLIVIQDYDGQKNAHV